MYLQNGPGRSYYDRDGTQHVSRSDFLLLIQPPGVEGCNHRPKALVRKVALKQFGHWMMGTARVYGESIAISGSYGGDGLTCSVSQEIYDRAAVELPKELYDLWNNGDGWNSCGNEAEKMQEWALEHINLLKK